MMIEYLGRELYVKYDYFAGEEETNSGAEVDIYSIKYNGRIVTRMVNNERIKEIIIEKEFYNDPLWD